MTREQIHEKLTRLFADGVLTEKRNYKDSDVNEKSNLKELSLTPFSKVLFVGDGTDSDVFAELKRLSDEKRVMSPLTAKVEKNLRTYYQLVKAVKDGTLMRFEYGEVILYID